MTRYGMLIDAGTCAGCNACTMACKYQNATPSGMYWCKVLMGEYGIYPNSGQVVLPSACMHCQDAPCVSCCPTGASHYDENGCVQIDYEKCIGCRMCINACPYNARSYHDEKQEDHPYYEGYEMTPYEQMRASEHPVGVVEKCVMCHGRTAEGKEPSCVQTCITKSRWFGDLDEPNSEINAKIKELGAKPLNEELGTKPSVYYAGLV